VSAHTTGAFRVLAHGGPVTGRMRYIANINVLCTAFEDGDARWEIVDFLPRIGAGTGRYDTPLEMCRIVRPLAGTPRLRIDFAPRPNYARDRGDLLVTQHGIEVLGAGGPLHLYSNVPGDYIVATREIPLREPMYFMLAWPRARAAAAHRRSPRVHDAARQHGRAPRRRRRPAAQGAGPPAAREAAEVAPGRCADDRRRARASLLAPG